MLSFTFDLLWCLWLACTLLALFGCFYGVYAGLLARRFARGRGVLGCDPQPVSILKPLYGLEMGLEANLTTFTRQTYKGPIQIVCGVQNDDDSAVDIVNKLKSKWESHDITLVSAAERHGENPKISNVINLAKAAKHGIVILTDSDISVAPTYVHDVVTLLQQPGVGLVTCLYRGRTSARIWSKLASAAIDQHFLPGVLVGLELGLAKPCFGSTIALRTDTLARIGGFGAFADTLADDYAIGKAVRDLGLTVTVAPFVVGHTFAEASGAELIAHELRWVRTIRQVDPMGYAGSVVTHPLPFALAALAVGGFTAITLAVLALVLACRLFVSIEVGRIPGGDRVPLWLTPLRDLLSFAVFALSYLPGTVRWRGASYTINADGSLKQM
jgi:ceramide glucosyltransferase